MLLRITSAYPNALDTIPGHTEYLVISVKHSQINGNKKKQISKGRFECIQNWCASFYTQ